MTSINSLMHPRNIYKNNIPDFKELAIKYAYFRDHSRENTNGDVSIDFKNPKALRALLCALLENDFDIKLEIPLDHLIPTLPLRLNYIHWIEDLLKCIDEYEDDIFGVDIGTGTSCIYPLIGTKLNGWKFLATEVDESSVKYAQHNVELNKFTDSIRVLLVNQGSVLYMPLEEANIKAVSFCMCNPPFFSSEEEATLGASRTDKRPLPISVNTGSTKETVTTGGEVEFVKGIIEDSFKLQQKVKWYTSMLGKKSSMKSVVAYLKQKQVPKVTTTRFCQGKTMRWGVAWTFLPGITLDQSTSPLSKRRKKESKSLSFNIPKDSSVLLCDERNSRFERALKLFDDILCDLKIFINERQLDSDKCCWQCSAFEITWSNQRRKRRERKRLTDNGTNGSGNGSVALKTSQPNGNESELNPNTVCNSVRETSKYLISQEEIKRLCPSDDSEFALEENAVQNDASIESTATPISMKASSSSKESSNPLSEVESENFKEAALCTFWVCLDGSDSDLRVEIGCIQAANKNHVYQFYQFLHNKLVKAL